MNHTASFTVEEGQKSATLPTPFFSFYITKENRAEPRFDSCHFFKNNSAPSSLLYPPRVMSCYNSLHHPLLRQGVTDHNMSTPEIRSLAYSFSLRLASFSNNGTDTSHYLFCLEVLTLQRYKHQSSLTRSLAQEERYN